MKEVIRLEKSLTLSISATPAIEALNEIREAAEAVREFHDAVTKLLERCVSSTFFPDDIGQAEPSMKATPSEETIRDRLDEARATMIGCYSNYVREHAPKIQGGDTSMVPIFLRECSQFVDLISRLP